MASLVARVWVAMLIRWMRIAGRVLASRTSPWVVGEWDGGVPVKCLPYPGTQTGRSCRILGGELDGDLGRGCRVQQEREGKGVRRFRKVPIEQLSGSSGAREL